MFNFQSILCSLCLAAVAAAPVSASVIRYQTPLERANWTFEGDVFGCHVSQEIQGFGRISLTASPDALPELILESDWFDGQATAQAQVIPSSWSANLSAHSVSLPMSWNERQASVKTKALNSFVEALELGYSWKVVVNKKESSGDGAVNNMMDSYEIIASSINAVEISRQFRTCRNKLLPKPFSYVRQRNLMFASGAQGLSPAIESDLKAIARYVLADPNISQILIDGHSDSAGDRLINLALSQQRAENVAGRLIEMGIDAGKIRVFHHGNRQPIASNATAAGRQKNRRVMVRLVKATPSPVEAVSVEELSSGN